MRAVVCHGYGGLDDAALEVVPSPPLAADGVRIAVHASCASFASLLVMQGRHQNRAEPPFTPGTEVAGVVLETGPRAGLFRPGERVIAAVRTGGYADEVVVPQQTVFALPDRVDFATGCQLPSVYGTAFAALVWRANVQAGETVLVHGAGGGSGLAAVEIAKVLGARVIACAGSRAKLDAAAEHGADELIDHRSQTVHERVRALTDGAGANVAYDPVGGEAFRESLRCLCAEGRLVTMGFASGDIPQAPANHLLVKNLDVIGVYWGHYLGWGRDPVSARVQSRVRDGFATMFEWMAQGRLRPRVHARLPLAQFRTALEMIAARDVVGRVVLLPRA